MSTEDKINYSGYCRPSFPPCIFGLFQLFGFTSLKCWSPTLAPIYVCPHPILFKVRLNAVIYRWSIFMLFLLHLLCWLYFTSDVVLSIITPFMLALLLTVLTSHGCCDQVLLLHPLPLYVCPSKLLWLTSFGCCSPS